MGGIRREHDLAGAALRGAVAGVVGGIAMKAVMQMEQEALLPEGKEMTPPPQKLVRKVAEKRDLELSEGQEQMAAMGVHMGYSALWGALHGVGSEVAELPPALHGLLLGGIVYFATQGPQGMLTKAGVTPSPLLQPISEAAIPAGAHLAFGLATAAAYEAMS